MFRWAGWFAVANSVLFGAVSLRYFGGGVTVDSPLAWIYLVSVYIGHHVLLTTIPLFLLATPLCCWCLDGAYSPWPPSCCSR